MKRWIAALGAMLVAVPLSAGETPANAIDEASGLAASRAHAGVFWTHNDGPNPRLVGDREPDPRLYALDAEGRLKGTVELPIDNQDWEDLAAFRWQGEDWLLVADTGNNDRSRKHGLLHLFPEPSPDQGEVSAERLRSIRFRFPDAVHDCEAVAVDPASNTILLVTKRSQPPVIYRLDLDVAGDDAVARRVGELTTLPPVDWVKIVQHPLLGLYAAQPTAMDISPDGRRVVISTYDDAHVYTRGPDQDWAEAFAARPQVLEQPGIAQYEGVAFGPDGQGIFVIAEGEEPRPLELDFR